MATCSATVTPSRLFGKNDGEKRRGGHEVTPFFMLSLSTIIFSLSLSFSLSSVPLGCLLRKEKTNGNGGKKRCSKKPEKENMEEKRNEGFLIFFLSFILSIRYSLFSREEKVSDTRMKT